MRRSLLAGLFLLTLALLATGLWRTRMVPTTVPLAEGRELRLLKVSRGTNHTYSLEPYWKRGLRWVLRTNWPGLLGPLQAQEIRTPFDSLVVWIEVVHPTNGHLAAPKSEQIKACLPEGHWVNGVDRSVAGGVTGCFYFSRFDRAARRVPLQFHDGTNTVSFTVNNPRPARPAAWTARSLAQTNQLFRTQMVLWKLSVYGHDRNGTPDHFQAGVVATASESANTGWLYIRVTGLDALGNWSRSGWHGPHAPSSILPMLSTQAAPWKLTVEAQEFISIGFVPAPTAGNHTVCSRGRRARELGVDFVVVADGGSYAITNGIVTRLGDCGWNPVAPPVGDWSSESNWWLRVNLPQPGIVCVSDNTAGSPPFKARLRERIGGNDGRIFWPQSGSELRFKENLGRAVGLFPIRLPNNTTNLEAEIVALHPPTEFFVTPPKSKPHSRN